MKKQSIVCAALALVLIVGLLPATTHAAGDAFRGAYMSTRNDPVTDAYYIVGISLSWQGSQGEMQPDDLTDVVVTRDGEPVPVTIERVEYYEWSNASGESGVGYDFLFAAPIYDAGEYGASFVYRGQPHSVEFLFALTGESPVRDVPSDAYLISSEADLRAFAALINSGEEFPGHYVLLTQDIALTDEWTPIGVTVQGDGWTTQQQFSGTFDGGGHRITGLRIGSRDNPSVLEEIGLFAFLPREVRNLALDVDIYVSPERDASCSVGGLAGRGGGIVRNCTVGGTIALVDEVGEYSSATVGGLVGDANGTIVACTASVGIESSLATVGGLLGVSWGHVGDCGATGDVSGMYVGGLIGTVASGAVEHCFATGHVTAAAQIDTSAAEYSPYMGASLGGLIGRISVNSGWDADAPLLIRNCYAAGDVTDNTEIDAIFSSLAGGFVGECSISSGSLEHCYAAGNVTAARAGGFAGYLHADTATDDDGQTEQGSFSVSHCYAAGNVASEQDAAYGFAVNVSVPLTDCAALGDVTAPWAAFGFANTYFCVFERCYATGNVTATEPEYGWAYAFGRGNIFNSYALSNATGANANAFELQSGGGCYYAGLLTGDRTNARFYGENCYGDMTVFPDGYTDTDSGKTTAEMQSPDLVTLLNGGLADGPWVYQAGGYPVLSYRLLPVHVAPAAGGTLYAPPYAGVGDEVPLYAVPDEGHGLVALTLDGAALDGAVFTMPNGAATVTATFAPLASTPDGANEPGTPTAPGVQADREDATPGEFPWWIVAAAIIAALSGAIAVWATRRRKAHPSDTEIS